MASSNIQSAPRPIGVLAALTAGFERVAARPALILPPLLLDLLLWLGPQVRITALIREAANAIMVPPGADPSLGDQVAALQRGLTALGDRFNLLGALSSLPAGIPSLMAGRMPAASPLGAPGAWQAGSPLLVLALWSLLTVVGLGMGALFQVGVARQLAPRGEVASGLLAWRRFLVMGLGFYLGLFAAGTAAAVLAGLLALVLPLLGVGAVFLMLSLSFWVAVYLAFTPHGIVRYRFGVLKAMLESAQVVRWNLPGTIGFLTLAFALTWLTGLVWAMPADNSWFSLLALLGHAFVSATLLAGSYAFYQGRHDWLTALRQAVAAQVLGRQGPPGSAG